jgi:uncharacterized protein (DUF1501 family)
MPCDNTEQLLRAEASRVDAELRAQDAAWGTGGWTRRRFIAGAGMVGVAAFASQLVTTRVAYAATAPGATTAPTNTLITIFLRGAADGLRMLVPRASSLGGDYLQQVRGGLVPSDAELIALPGTSGWGLNAAVKPLYDLLWQTGELAFVPAVSATGISRSHFQAQQYVDKGGSDTATSGWLDRALAQLGPGTTFRAVGMGTAEPFSLVGSQRKIVVDSLKNFQFPGWDEIRPQSQRAVAKLYRGMDGVLGADVPATMAALAEAGKLRARAGVRNGATYPSGPFAGALQDLATMLHAEAGLQVATIDVGGWDTHTDERRDFDQQLGATAQALAAFMTDLGAARRKRVTVVVVTEFGRRVAMNASGGTDHGHGSVAWLLGGGLTGSGVLGKWAPLDASSEQNGDVPGLNNVFDVLGELAHKRLGVGALSKVFPGHSYAPLGVAR